MNTNVGYIQYVKSTQTRRTPSSQLARRYEIFTILQNKCRYTARFFSVSLSFQFLKTITNRQFLFEYCRILHESV